MENRQQLRNSTAGALPADVPAEGWYQVDLQGRWEGHPSGAYRLTPADIRCIVEYFNQACRANGVDLPVDYEHQGVVAKLLGKGAESGGWINSLEGRNNDTELWAHIKWVADARALIRDRKFRYLSSHLVRDYKDPVTGRVIPWALDSVALTNRPFKKELPAVANSAAGAPVAQPPSAVENVNRSQPRAAVPSEKGRAGAPGKEDGAMNQLLALPFDGAHGREFIERLAAAMNEGRASAPALDAKAVANSLGVPEDAGTDAVVKAVAERLTALVELNPLKARLKVFAHSLGVAETADESVIAAAIAGNGKPANADAGVKLLSICNALGTTPDKPLAELLALIGSTRALPAQSAAEKLIENAISVERKITPANREAFIRLAMQDFEGARRILNSMPPVLGGATNAAGAQSASETAVLSEADRWACEQAGLKEGDFLATKKRMAG